MLATFYLLATCSLKDFSYYFTRYQIEVDICRAGESLSGLQIGLGIESRAGLGLLGRCCLCVFFARHFRCYLADHWNGTNDIILVAILIAISTNRIYDINLVTIVIIIIIIKGVDDIIELQLLFLVSLTG